ncbi:hypothetical protein EMIT0P12_80134 [Pseudomonas sp. IT-P12]
MRCPDGNARKAATGFRRLPLFCRFLTDTFLVGAGLLAMAVGQPRLLYLTHRFREQARSHRGGAWQEKNHA